MTRLLLWAALALLAHPLFLVIYRLSVFNTVPHDDYAGYLLWLLHQPGAAFPDSPYAYRIGSMALAAPFYAALPPIPLTNTPAGLTPEYLRATAAVSMLAYISWLAAALLTSATARRVGQGPQVAVVAGLLTFACTAYTQVTAIDPLAIAFIAAGTLLLHRPAAFATLLALSIPINEKVALVLALWLTLRCATSCADRAALWRQAAAALLAVAAYLAAVKLLHLPGNPYQTDPARVPQTLHDNLLAYATARGLLFNVLPALILAALALVGQPCAPFSRRDALLVPALLAIALVLTQFFQVGRIVMHAAPILAIPAAIRIAAPARNSPALIPFTYG